MIDTLNKYKISVSEPSAQLLCWLQILLEERFGHKFQLAFVDGWVRLRLSTNSGYIAIKSDIKQFSVGQANIACELWNARIENWMPPIEDVLPAPGAEKLKFPLIEFDGAGHLIHYDILGLSYWMLARLEEVGRTDLDNHERFPATASHAFRYGYLERPIVDEWMDILRQVILLQWPDLILRHNIFSVKVSHDVDSPSFFNFIPLSTFFRNALVSTIKNKSLVNIFKSALIRFGNQNILHREDPYNTFEWIMDISDYYGLTSAFYFICGRSDASKDAGYEPEHSAIRNLMRRIHERGHELGLHPSYNTYKDVTLMASEAMRLRRICTEEDISQDILGGRTHYLRWEMPSTLQGLELAGMDYDSSLGYADLPGFRCGTCFEYPAFDPMACRILKLRIRPLIVMECTIMAERYMGLGNGDAAYKKFVKLKSACRSVNGCFTLLWHNSSFESAQNRALYQCVLEK